MSVQCSPDDPAFTGLFATLDPDNEEERPSATQIIDDYEGEQETLLSCCADIELGDEEEDPAMDVEDDNDVGGITGFSQLNDTVRNASKGVTEGTDAEYKRSVSMATTIFVLHFIFLGDSQMARFISFLTQKGLIKTGESFFSSTPHRNSPLYIAAWIMDT
jgi:hypothetical protein